MKNWPKVHKFQSKATYTKEEIARCGIMTSDHKITKISLAGSVAGSHKVNSRLAKVVGEQVMQGHDPRISIIGKLDDPDTNGADYILHEGVSFDDLTLMDWGGWRGRQDRGAVYVCILHLFGIDGRLI